MKLFFVVDKTKTSFFKEANADIIVKVSSERPVLLVGPNTMNFNNSIFHLNYLINIAFF